MIRGKRIVVLSVLLIILMTAVAFSGCNSVTVISGTVINKTIGEPLLFSIGELKMIDPRAGATNFCIWVQAENGDTAGFYVTEAVFNLYSVGDWFEYDSNLHFAA